MYWELWARAIPLIRLKYQVQCINGYVDPVFPALPHETSPNLGMQSISAINRSYNKVDRERKVNT